MSPTPRAPRRRAGGWGPSTRAGRRSRCRRCRTQGALSPYRLVEYTSTQRGLPDARHERHFARAGGGLHYRWWSSWSRDRASAQSSTGHRSRRQPPARCGGPRRNMTAGSDRYRAPRTHDSAPGARSNGRVDGAPEQLGNAAGIEMSSIADDDLIEAGRVGHDRTSSSRIVSFGRPSGASSRANA
jgi:hypothetical protein